MVRLLCEAAEKSKFSVNLTSVFTFIGMVFSIVVSLVALVWLTCFVVRLLIKTFKKQVQNSYDIFVENSEAKTKSKKARNVIKREAKDARKMEILNMKEESRERIHKMKVDKLGMKLNEDENKAREKYGITAEPEKTISEKIKRQQALENLEKENLKKDVVEEKEEPKKKESKKEVEEPKKEAENETKDEVKDSEE